MKINEVKLSKILDSRGEWTIEVEILSEGLKEKASIPTGKSRGSYEAFCLSYDEIRKKMKDFVRLFKYLDFEKSIYFDHFLIEKCGIKKENIGANFTLGLSIAFARILAKKFNLTLWEYLKNEYGLNIFFNLPGLIINVIGGGVHSHNNLVFQEYWLVLNKLKERSINYFEDIIGNILKIIKILEKKLPKPIGRNDEGAFSTNFLDSYEPFIYLNDVIKDFSFFEIGSDIAANQIGSDFNIDYQKLKNLNVKYLEDPLKEDDFDGFSRLKNESFKIIGDDLTVTNTERLKIALEKNSVDGVIVKPNQIGTILETFEFVKLAKENNLFTVFSHRSGETNDNWIIDLGFAFGADFLKIGCPVQGERVVKYNRILEILRELK